MVKADRLLPLNTVREIVAAWGGTSRMAEWAGIKPPNVSQWLLEERIPPGWHYRMDREARRNGYLINPLVFGDKPSAQEAQFLKEQAS